MMGFDSSSAINSSVWLNSMKPGLLELRWGVELSTLSPSNSCAGRLNRPRDLSNRSKLPTGDVPECTGCQLNGKPGSHKISEAGSWCKHATCIKWFHGVRRPRIHSSQSREAPQTNPWYLVDTCWHWRHVMAHHGTVSKSLAVSLGCWLALSGLTGPQIRNFCGFQWFRDQKIAWPVRFFPRASERRVLLIVGVCYIHIQTS